MNRKMNFIFALVVASLLSLGALAQQAEAPKKQAPPAGSAPRPFTVPPSQTFSLPNGLQATLVPYGNVPKATIIVTVRAGALNEAADQVWISDFTGRLIKEGGTKTKSANQVAQEAASMGGAVDVTAGPDRTQLSSDVLSELTPKMVALLADLATHPALPDSEMPRLKQDSLRNLSIEKSRPQPLARERFMKTLYPDHPYGRLYPTEEMIQKYTGDDVRKFYASNFGAARTHVYIAGKFDPDAVKQAITAAFSSWPKGPDVLVNPPKAASKRTLELIDRPNAAQSTLYIGLPTVDPSNPDYLPLQVMNTLLGGSFGSRITSNIREQKGYTYSPFGQLSARYRSAYWAEIADVTTAVTGASIKEILFEVNRLQKEAPSAEELKGIQDYMAGVFVLQNSSRFGIIGQLANVDLHGLGPDYLKNYVQNVYAVTPERVQQLAEKYLDTDKMTIVVVGDKSKIGDQIAPYQPSGQ